VPLLTSAKRRLQDGKSGFDHIAVGALGEDNYGIFQKTSEDNHCSNRVYFYCLDCWAYDVAFVGKIGRL